MNFNFTHNSDGSTICEIIVNGELIRGIARLNPKDKDFESARVGEEIASQRAIIKVFKKARNELRIRLNTMIQFYNRYKHNADFNAKCEEEIMSYKLALAVTEETIIDYETQLNTYIKNKEAFYEKMTKLRSDKTEEKVVD